MRAKAWFLHAGSAADRGRLAELRLETFELRDPGDHELLVEPLYGCWEGNMNHALLRTPIDVCEQRGEPRVILGNSGVVRVLTAGAAVGGFAPGDLALLFSASVVDAFGYPEKALAYDAPGTMGCLATRMIVRPHELIALPPATRHALPQWAAFSGRYITAWSNWVQAAGTLRLQLTAEELPAPHVWGWGGGSTLAELDLARRGGARTVMLSADPRRLELIARSGVTALDRRTFGDLRHDPRRAAADPAALQAYLDAEAAFLREVERRTAGERVHVFVDYIGTPFFRVTLKALARQGVIATAGWQQGMAVAFLRASECIARHQYVHTHYARRSQGLAAVRYAEAEGWMPTVDERCFGFEEIPELARRFAGGDVGFFPVFAVNPI